jgi:hypothetical protein
MYEKSPYVLEFMVSVLLSTLKRFISSLINLKMWKSILFLNFLNIDQIIDQCYSLVNLTPSDVFCLLHIELQQVKVALTSETLSERERGKVFTMVRIQNRKTVTLRLRIRRENAKLDKQNFEPKYQVVYNIHIYQ